MTYYDAWIATSSAAEVTGRVEGSAGYRQPTERSPFLPEGRQAFFCLRDGIKSGTYRGRQVDWGSYAASMTRQEVEAFLKETHGAPGIYEKNCGLTHLADRMRELRAFVANLPESTELKVVVEEF